MKNSASFKSELSKFGIGLFETIKIENGNAKNLDMHIERLFNSLMDLNIVKMYEEKYIKNIILEYVKVNKITNKALRLTMFDEGYNISVRDIVYDEEMYTKGLKLLLSPIKRGDSIIYKHKTTNYFENIYTKKYANSKGFDDGVFVNTHGYILECSMSNIFFIKNNIIYTPKKSLPLLNGITKKRISDVCEELGIQIIETDIKITEIDDFEFCFVSNSLMGVMKITQIEDTKYNLNNKVFSDLRRIIR